MLLALIFIITGLVIAFGATTFFLINMFFRGKFDGPFWAWIMVMPISGFLIIFGIILAVFDVLNRVIK